MKKILFFVLITFLGTLYSFEEASYLKIEPSVRIAGMGESGIAIASGVQDIFLNPAALSRMGHMSLSANYTNWMSGIGTGFAGFGFRRMIKEKPSQNAFAFSIFGVNVEGIEKRNIDGELLGTFGSSSYVFTLTFSRDLFKGIYGGFNVKYLYDNIDGDVAYGYAIDMGLLYWVMGGFGFGLSIRNLGPGLSSGSREVLTRTDFSLPMDVRMGMSYLRNTGFGNFVWNLDLINSLTGNPPALATGFEFDIKKSFYIRFGLKKSFGDKVIDNGELTKVSENTFSLGAGFGIRYGNFIIDYAYYSRNDFIKPHRLSVSINF